MSVTAVGVHTDLDGPLPVARRFSLLATPGIVVEQAGPDDTPRWINGVIVDGYPDGVPQGWEPCTTGTNRVKDSTVGDTSPSDRFDPIAVYFPVECSSHGLGNPDRLIERVDKVLDATLSHGVENALANPVIFSTNPFLGDASLVQLGGGAVSPQTGLGYLENAIGENTGRQGLIHATPAIVAAWGFGSELTFEGSDVDAPPGNSAIRTRNGTPVISGSGYIGADPIGKTASGATTEWAFATGLVQVRIAQVAEAAVVDVIDRDDNTIVIRAERYVLYDWDTALQVGVLIDWSL